jgi:formylglycine-generating enzyme required for sulfatase activity
MMKTIFKKSITLVIVLFFCSKIFANGITVSNVTFVQNTNEIQFDVSWENSWRSDVLQNWDAAYIFMKYKTIDGLWKDIYIQETNYTIPAGFSLYTQGFYGGFQSKMGFFLYRSIVGSGNVSLTGVKIVIPPVLNNGINIGLGIYDVKVFGIEMVHIPSGSFFAGDNASTNSYRTDPANNTPYFIKNNSTDIATNIDPLNTTTTIGSLTFPNGYNAFYCMKYEISQGAYRDFLNTLSYAQQANHIAVSPASSLGNGAFGNFLNTASIEIATAGIASSTPAVFGCDANNNNTYNEVGDGEWVACNYITWADVAAYLSWAGLAPMTELQLEKVCRGPLQPVAGEYAWGNTSIIASQLNVINFSQINESFTNASTTLGNANYLTTNSGAPRRNGIFATATSNRTTSGGAFYGVLDLDGNLWERVVTTANNAGISFTGVNGLGSSFGLTLGGASNPSNWPKSDGTPALGLMYRGGAFDSPASLLRTSNRGPNLLVTTADNLRDANLGGRGVFNIY